MKTTLHIDHAVFTRLETEALKRGCTTSELVESALRILLGMEHGTAPERPELPSWNMGPTRVDVANRDALYRAMEER